MMCKGIFRSSLIFFVSIFLLFITVFLSHGVLVEAATVPVTTVVLTPDASGSHGFNFVVGGDFTFTNSDSTYVTFDVPANCFSEDTTLYTNSYNDSVYDDLKPAPAGKDFIGKVYDFSLFTTSGSETVTSFCNSFEMVLNYSDDDIGSNDESTVAPYKRGSSDTSWNLVPGYTLDTANNTITFYVSSFSSFAVIAEPSSGGDGGSSSSSSSGGGGGGGGGVVSTANVVFSGKAYPSTNVTLLKDGQQVAVVSAGPDANFSISLSGLSAGTYTFGVWGLDISGRRSITHTFTISVTTGVTTTVSGIFLPPTIGVDKIEVKWGDSLTILGNAAPDSEVTVFINSEHELIKNALSNKVGSWSYKFDTLEVNRGDHTTRARAESEGGISTFSNSVNFKVGSVNILAPVRAESLLSDMNGDGRVNLIDFSIAAFWYKKESPPSHIDTNSDGEVNLIDFSIMAFYWTG